MEFETQGRNLSSRLPGATPRQKRWLLALLIAVISCCPQCVYAFQAGAEPIALARAVHNMPAEQAVHGYSVHVRAVITYYHPYLDPRRGVVFVCDGSGCVFVSVPVRPMLSIQPGDLVEITGITSPGDYASIVEASQIKKVGHPGLPRRARKVTMNELASGVYDTEWIQVKGRVRSIHQEPHIVSLIVATEGGSFGAVTSPEPGVAYDQLVDSLVELTANTAPVFNRRRQMVAVHLFFPSMRQVRVIEPAPPDPFSKEPISVLDMFRFSNGDSARHRVHVQGTVTLNWPGRMLCIQDHDSPLCMQAPQATAIPVGSRVDIVGFPGIRFFKPTLEYAVFRRTDPAVSSISPIVVSAERIFKDDLDGKLVQVDAELVGQDHTSPDLILMMRAKGVLFSLVVPREISQSTLLPWRDGSLLRITGICNTEVNTYSISIGDGIVRPESVKILLRNEQDITLLRAPSWWTPQHALQGFGAIGFVVALCLAWIAVLRHSVKLRTGELRASEERLRYLSEHDAVTKLPNRILLQDRLSTALNRARRFGGKVGLLLADLDGFKEVNDQLGHQAGDRVLNEVAGRTTASVRSTDTVARIGGDEFVILLPDIRHATEAEQVAAKIAGGISEPILVDERIVRITASIGIAIFPDDTEKEKVLMQLADEAMYRAKQSGKDRIEVSGRRTPAS